MSSRPLHHRREELLFSRHLSGTQLWSWRAGRERHVPASERQQCHLCHPSGDVENDSFCLMHLLCAGPWVKQYTRIPATSRRPVRMAVKSYSAHKEAEA